MKKFLCLLLLLGLTGCAKKVVSPSVPGSIDSFDALAFRVLADAQAALIPIKTWEQCTALGNPPTVVMDGNVQVCAPAAGYGVSPFPVRFKSVLNDAIIAYNNAQIVAKAYHDGLSTDEAALQSNLIKLQDAVSKMLVTIGGK